ncbi:MAG: sigma-70 family RNA polymerase sigma factor [Alphaproteobacteria bacterium]|nr:sigma-70 family RNA polymerase sigma factor [Alphaproteobacteria bacterium]MCB9759622.1 sigma-70 family RNA polymerase sigma factor [Alphaproteobacteria bacterium]
MDLDQLSDEELMERVQADDAAAYRVLFDRHNRTVYGYLLRKTRQPELAAELFQETWLKVHRARSTWNPGQAFRPWLFSIAVNTRRDSGRRDQRRIDTVELTRPTPAPRNRPEERLTLEAAIDKLPEPLREAFLLGAVHGFDHNELAEQLGISAANARARVSRARKALRELLGVRS